MLNKLRLSSDRLSGAMGGRKINVKMKLMMVSLNEFLMDSGRARQFSPDTFFLLYFYSSIEIIFPSFKLRPN